MKSEEDILRRLKRRLRSARASVMLEFAFVAPLAVVAALFAADFTRILRTEQQLEIATRLAADVEAHMANHFAKQGDANDGGQNASSAGKNTVPCTATKSIAKSYLVEIAQITPDTKYVYMKGMDEVVKNPVSVAIDAINKFLTQEIDFGSGKGVQVFVDLFGKILHGAMNLVTFRTLNYVTDVVPHDREVKISMAAYIPTILPKGAYSGFSVQDRENSMIGVASFAPTMNMSAAATAWSMTFVTNERHRVYCYMPVMDSVPVAPVTYVRKFKSWCANQPFIGGLAK